MGSQLELRIEFPKNMIDMIVEDFAVENGWTGPLEDFPAQDLDFPQLQQIIGG